MGFSFTSGFQSDLHAKVDFNQISKGDLDVSGKREQKTNTSKIGTHQRLFKQKDSKEHVSPLRGETCQSIVMCSTQVVKVSDKFTGIVFHSNDPSHGRIHDMTLITDNIAEVMFSPVRLGDVTQ